MTHERFMLGDYAEGFETKSYLDCYFLESSEEYSVTYRPLMLIFPGGGYTLTSDREAEPIARLFNALGYHAAVLRYTCNQTHPEALLRLPLYEGALSMKLLRSMSEKYLINKNNIGIIGFSAGGHAAGTLGTMWQSEWLREINVSAEDARPNAMILSYPVVTADERYWHSGSFVHLLGEDMTAEDKLYWSLENRVTENCPPTFIWSTANDSCVPIMNTILFTKALAENGISFEEHIFPDGVHGLSTARREVYAESLPYITRWVDFAEKWITNIFDF